MSKRLNSKGSRSSIYSVIFHGFIPLHVVVFVVLDLYPQTNILHPLDDISQHSRTQLMTKNYCVNHGCIQCSTIIEDYSYTK